MTPTDLSQVLTQLAARRPVFHSEADLQHEFALEVRTLPSVQSIRLERPFRFDDMVINLDVLVHASDYPIAIELKYWRKAGKITHSGESFETRSDGAKDVARYEFWKDVVRIERLVEAGVVRWGAALCITDDPAYWAPDQGPGTLDAAFRLYDGRQVSGTLAWSRRSGTTKGREQPHNLAGNYRLEWGHYSDPGREFRYLAVVVARETPNP